MSVSRSHFVRSWLLLAGAVLFAATVAYAQPRPHGPGTTSNLPPLAMVLLNSEIHTALALTPPQETQWTTLQSAEQNLRSQAQSARNSLQALVAAELADALPDLVAIENAMVADRQAMAAAAAAVSSQAVALYSGLSTAQQAIVVSAVQAQAHRPQPRG